MSEVTLCREMRGPFSGSGVPTTKPSTATSFAFFPPPLRRESVRLRVSAFGFSVYCLGFRDFGLWFRIEGSWFMVYD